jgi:SAM-dependent methyltransferase
MPAGSGDRWPEDYERGRPGWPADAIDVAELPGAATVLDLGAGTGKLTRLLDAQFAQVVAVEPSEPMRQALIEHCPGVEALTGTGQEIPVADGSVDAVFAAQAFHWFDEPGAIAEIARVLRPGGALILMWNRPAGPWEPPTEAAESVLTEQMPEDLDHIPLDLGGPAASSGWRPAVNESPFGAFKTAVFPNQQVVCRDGLVAFYASMGWLADLPDDDRLPLLARVRACLPAPEYRRMWETHVHWTRLDGTCG